MKKFHVLFEKFSIKVVTLLTSGMFFAFTFWAAKYRHEYPRDLTTERVIGNLDNPVYNICVLIIFFFIIIFLKTLILKGNEQQQRKKVRILAISWTLLLGLLLSIWVTICHITPVQDQLQIIYGATEFHSGDFSQMDTYYDTNPHQYGLTFIYELFIGFCPYYQLFQYFNVIFIMVIVYFIYLVTDELFHCEEMNFYALVATSLFLPLPLYVNFVYGELWNMSFGIVTIWAILKRLSTQKQKYSILAFFAMSIAVIARKNILVWAIALMIMLTIYAIKHLNPRLFVLGILILLIPILSLKAVYFSYELRSGKNVGSGAPAWAYIAMGLDDRWEGPGYYSGYNNMVYVNDANRDTELAAQLAKDEIREKVNVLVSDLHYARDFFQRKIWQQWNEGTYNALIMTCNFTQEPNDFVKNVYYGNIANNIYNWSNYYLFIMYFFILIYSVVSFIKGKNIERCIPLIIFVGALILSIIWETKARYMFPHTTLMFPCIAAGIYYTRIGICHLLQCIKNHISK